MAGTGAGCRNYRSKTGRSADDIAGLMSGYKTYAAWHVLEPTTPFVPGWHLDAICEHLEAVNAGQIRNLLINMPPRHMKSLAVSVFWPVWTWLKRPGFDGCSAATRNWH
jgi:hypothetical protein